MKLEEEAKEKRGELTEIVRDTATPFVSNPEQLAERIIDHFCVVTPPEIDTSVRNISLDMITTRGGFTGGAISRKSGNIWLNWKKLLIHGAESVLTVVGAVSIPWLIPLAGLVVWNRVWSLLNIKIDERHAAVIWFMWENRDEENCIEHDKILGLVNEGLRKYNRPTMGEEELNNILTNLEKMQCIEKSDDNKWWLREWVKAVY